MKKAPLSTPYNLWSALAALAFLFSLAGNAHADFTTWTLTNGTASWISANWSNSIPTTTSTAYLNNPGTANVETGVSGTVDTLYIGNTGKGNLLVAGGYLSDAVGSIGNKAGSSGSVAMTGGTWATSNELYVGNYGTGVLTISGGRVTDAYGSIGYMAGSSGTVTVTGGTWVNSNDLYIGSSGSGALTISGSGVVFDQNGYIGSPTPSLDTRPSSGIATVTGGTWTNSWSLTVGNTGTGTLNITDSGVVNSWGYLIIASDAGSKGTLNIGTGGTAGTLNTPEVYGGSGSATVNFNHTGATTFAANLTGTMTVNKLGSGTTTLTGESSFSGTTNITGGRLNVNGSFSTWENTINVQNGGILGGSGSVGAITVTGGTIAVDSGTLTATYLTLDAASTVKLQLGNALHVTTSLVLAGTLDLSGMDSLTLGSDPVLLIDCDPDETALKSFDVILVSGSAVVINSKTFSTTTFTAANDKTYMIKYRGGRSKNDVTIEAVPEPATWTLIFAGVGALALLRLKRV